MKLYLATSDLAINAILVVDRSIKQEPIYFVNRTLQGAEARYPLLEKLVLALIFVAQCLWPYFQAHTIHVLANANLKKILLKPKAFGHFAKWAIEIREFDLEYHPRPTIKGQVLVDFLVEAPLRDTPVEAKHEEKTPTTSPAELLPSYWKVYVDGASGKGFGGARLLVVSPEGNEIAYYFYFLFPTTNDTAEYEALPTSFRLALTLQARRVFFYSDSQIIVNQVQGIFQAKKETIMQKYLASAQVLICQLEHFQITQIPREENKRVDSLSKLANQT